MKAEHCHMSGHDAKFECSSHYESSGDFKPKTSSREEWDAVVHGKVPDSLKKFRLNECYRDKKTKDSNCRKVDVFSEHTASDSDVLSRSERLGLALYTGPMVTPPSPTRSFICGLYF